MSYSASRTIVSSPQPQSAWICPVVLLKNVRAQLAFKTPAHLWLADSPARLISWQSAWLQLRSLPALSPFKMDYDPMVMDEAVGPSVKITEVTLVC